MTSGVSRTLSISTNEPINRQLAAPYVDTRTETQNSTCDEFVPSSTSYTTPSRPKSFLSNIAGKVLGFLRKLNPLPYIVRFIENYQCQNEIENARLRNGAQTQEEVIKYHESLYRNVFTTNFLERGETQGIRQRARRAVYIILGNSQTLTSPQEEAGLISLYNQLKNRRDLDVYLVRVGCATQGATTISDFARRIVGGTPRADYSLAPEVVFNHTRNLFRDSIHGDGLFRSNGTYETVSIIGYSWGAGTGHRLAHQWRDIGNGTTLRMFCIDPIRYGISNFGNAEDERPESSVEHVHVYQENDYIYGIPLLNPRPTDRQITIRSTHNEIDNNPYVLELARRFALRGLE
jgi:hypothetical protein